MNRGSKRFMAYPDNEILPTRLVEYWSGIDQDNVEVQQIDRYVCWQVQPIFRRIGRSAFLVLKTPIEVPAFGISIRAFKLKGVGARTNADVLMKPTIEPVRNSNPHLGFNDRGDFIAITGDTAPLGGITLDRALREFEVSKCLLANGCPSIVPIRVYEYTDAGLKFRTSDGAKWQPLGVVVTGLLDSYDIRADLAFDYPNVSAEEDMILSAWSEQLCCSSENLSSLSLITELARGYGRTIRKFGTIGYYRYSGAPDNYSYSCENKQVLLVDLDSCCSLDDTSAAKKALEIIRDVASGIYYLIATMAAPSRHHRFSPDKVAQYAPFSALLSGYFYDVEEKYIQPISEGVTRYYAEVWNGADSPEYGVAHTEENLDVVRNFKRHVEDSFKRPWISRAEGFSRLMPLICMLYYKSEMMRYIPLSINVETVLRKVAAFSSTEIAQAARKALKPLER